MSKHIINLNHLLPLKKETYIKFLGADEGKLIFHLNNNTKITSSDPKIIAEVISKYSLYDYYCSSSMEFASEHGFPNNNSAMKLFDKAEKLNSKLRRVK